MNKDDVLKAIQEIKEKSSKRNFKQTYDVVINLKDLDIAKAENQVDFFVTIPHSRGRSVKVCALIGPEMVEESKACDKIITLDEFPKYASDKKATKKLAEDFDIFIAQANLMAQVASSFGRILGVRGKMPNPKAGCVVPPKTNLKPLVERLQTTLRLSAKKVPIIYVAVGNEGMPDNEVAENIMYIYDQLIHHLPGAQDNIKNLVIKFTMGKPVKVK